MDTLLAAVQRAAADETRSAAYWASLATIGAYAVDKLLWPALPLPRAPPTPRPPPLAQPPAARPPRRHRVHAGLGAPSPPPPPPSY